MAVEPLVKHLEPNGKFEKSEASDPNDGYYSTTCMFLYKETSGFVKKVALEQPVAEPGAAPPEQVFEESSKA